MSRAKWRIIQPVAYSSMLGGDVEWHSDTRNWQYAVSGAPRYASREAAQAEADSLPDVRDWRGRIIGRPRVVKVAS